MKKFMKNILQNPQENTYNGVPFFLLSCRPGQGLVMIFKAWERGVIVLGLKMQWINQRNE